MDKVIINKKGQAMPKKVIPVGREAFDVSENTEIYWLGNAGVLINSRGTIIMFDPLLKDFDMPWLFNSPLEISDIEKTDAVLITHIDSDHFSRQTCKALGGVCKEFHSTEYVAKEAAKDGIFFNKHKIGDRFTVGNVKITLTPTKHNWQSEKEEFNYRIWKEEDYCGYCLDTPDGRIWLPGDSRLLESHLHMPTPDVILLDFSDDSWHITLEGAVKLADTYPDARLVLIHWGTIDAPGMLPFCSNPEDLFERVNNAERVCVLFPGEKLTLNG